MAEDIPKPPAENSKPESPAPAKTPEKPSDKFFSFADIISEIFRPASLSKPSEATTPPAAPPKIEPAAADTSRGTRGGK